MQPANATNPMLQRHSFLWQRLREWLATALDDHAHTLEYRTRDQLIPLRIWITLIENLLRRLILMAASTAKVDVQAQWSPQPKPEEVVDAQPEPQPEAPADIPAETPPATPKSNTSHFRFRLYGIHWPRKANTGAASTFTGAAPPTATSTHALITIRIHIRDPLLNVGERPARRKKSRTRTRRSTAKRARTSKHGPDLTVEDLLAYAAARSDTGSSGEAAWKEMLADVERENRAYLAYQNALASEADTDWRDDDDEPECRDQTDDAPAVSPLQPEPQPELVSTKPLIDRLAVLAEIARNPEKLIQRAARAFARRREIALKLSRLATRKQTGLLADSRHLYGTLIPLDAEFRLAMEYFAVSYVEDDSS